MRYIVFLLLSPSLLWTVEGSCFAGDEDGDADLPGVSASKGTSLEDLPRWRVLSRIRASRRARAARTGTPPAKKSVDSGEKSTAKRDSTVKRTEARAETSAPTLEAEPAPRVAANLAPASAPTVVQDHQTMNENRELSSAEFTANSDRSAFAGQAFGEDKEYKSIVSRILKQYVNPDPPDPDAPEPNAGAASAFLRSAVSVFGLRRSQHRRTRYVRLPADGSSLRRRRQGDFWENSRIKIYGWADPSYNASTSVNSNIPLSYSIVPKSSSSRRRSSFSNARPTRYKPTTATGVSRSRISTASIIAIRPPKVGSATSCSSTTTSTAGIRCSSTSTSTSPTSPKA